MSIRRTFLVGGLLLFVAVGTLLTNVVANAASQHITMSPSSTDVIVDPGETYRGKATLVNQGDDSFSASVSVSPYRVKNYTYNPEFKPIDGAADPTKWITITNPTDQVEMTPRKTVDVQYTLSVPEGTPAGGYYAVLFGTSTPLKSEGQGVIRHNKVGNILYITVGGAVKQEGAIKAEPVSTFSFGGEVKIPAEISNTGGVHFKSTYKVKITSVFGGEVFSSDMPGYVLPQTKRNFSTAWSPDTPFGAYKISRSAQLPSGEVKVADSWVIVMNPALLVGLVLILLAAFAWVIGRKKSRRRG